MEEELRAGGVGEGRDIPLGFGGGAWTEVVPGAQPNFPGEARGAAAEAGPRARSLALRPNLARPRRSLSLREPELARRPCRSRAESSSPPDTGRSAGRRVSPPQGLGTVGGSEPVHRDHRHHRAREPGSPLQAWPEHAGGPGVWTEEKRDGGFHVTIAWALGGEKSGDFAWHGAEVPGAY